MGVETLAAAPQYQATKPKRVKIPGIGQGEYIIFSLPDLGDTFKPLAEDLLREAKVIANSAELAQPRIPLAQAEQAAKVGYKAKEKRSAVVLTVKDIFAKGSERFNRIRPRRPRRSRCLHGKLKTEPCERCAAEVKSKNKS